MFIDCFSKKSSVACKKRNKLLHNLTQFSKILKMLPSVCFPFLCWVKFCGWLFWTDFFSFGRQKKWLLVALGRWPSYTVTIVWVFPISDLSYIVVVVKRIQNALFQFQISVTLQLSRKEFKTLCSYF